MKRADEKVTLFNNVLCAFIINQGFFSLWVQLWKKTLTLFNIKLLLSSEDLYIKYIYSTLPFLWTRRVIGMAVDSNALALLCL